VPPYVRQTRCRKAEAEHNKTSPFQLLADKTLKSPMAFISVTKINFYTPHHLQPFKSKDKETLDQTADNYRMTTEHPSVPHPPPPQTSCIYFITTTH